MPLSLVRRLAALSCLLLAFSLSAQTRNTTHPPAANLTHLPAAVQANYGQLPLSFEQNTGQTASEVQWLARGPESTLFLSGNDATVEVHHMEKVKRDGVELLQARSASLRMSLLHSQPAQSSRGEQMQPGKANYFTGNDSSRWHTNVSLYAQVRLDEVYPGVNLLYHGERGQLEYDFVVAPNADPSAISLGFTGATPALAANGDLLLPIPGDATVRFDKPVVYQMNHGARVPVDSRYLVAKDGHVAFQLGHYDRTRELVIDPKLVFLGTIAAGIYPYSTDVSQITVDSTGAMYFIGTTNDPTYPVTPGAYQKVCGPANSTFAASGGAYCLGGSNASGSSSAYVTKISADGTTLVYSTYLSGGGGYEQGKSIAVDSSGVAYLLGATASNDFPITSDAFQTMCLPGQAPGFHAAMVPSAQCNNFGNGGGTEYTINGPVFFFAKLSADGSSLIYSSFLGGSDAAYPVATALDSAGNWYLYGQTSALLLSNVYPGTGSNSVQFPGVSANGYQTYSTAYYNTNGNGYNNPEDIAVVGVLSKFSNDGHTLLYGTFFGDETNGYPFLPTSMAVGANGVAFIGGNSLAAAMPTTAGAVKPSCTVVGGTTYTCTTTDGFVAAFDTTKAGGASLVYSTRIGGTVTSEGTSPTQQVLGVGADSNNDVYVTGHTYDHNFPVPQNGYINACSTANPSNPSNCDVAFVLGLNPTATAILGGSYITGPPAYAQSSVGYQALVDSKDHVYLYGTSQDGEDSFPLLNPVQAYQNNNELYIVTMSPDLTQLLFGTRIGNPSLNNVNEAAVSGGLALDPANNIYFAGTTNDATFAATPGTYTTAVASGGENHTFFGKISPVLPVGVTTLTITPGTTTTDQPVLFTASVAAVAGNPSPTGSVALSYTTPSNTTPTAFETLQLGSTGSATYSTTSLAAGVYTFTGTYSGDSNYDVSTSSAATVTINTPVAATLSLTSSGSPVVAGTSVTFTATASGAKGTPTGTVTFLNGTTTLGTATLNGSGVAMYPTSFSKAGSYSITASYGGDTTYGAVVSSAVTEVVTSPAPTITLASSAPKATPGYSVTFTATLTGNGSSAPTGTVTFLDGTTTLGTGTIGNGTATYTTTALATGTHSITASYGGDSNNGTAVSAAFTETIVAASFTVTYTPNPVVIQLGSSGTTTMTVTPGAAYSGTLTFGCNGTSANITCGFNPTTLTWAASNSTSAQTSVITINTTAPQSVVQTAGLGVGTWLGTLAASLALLLLVRRRKLNLVIRRLALLVFVIAGIGALAGLSGCSGSSPAKVGGTPTGTQSLSITFNGADNAAPLSVTVQ